MILFIIVAVCFLCTSLTDIKSEGVIGILLSNIAFNIVNFFACLSLSCLIFAGSCFIFPREESQWEFRINAMQDNLVTQGRMYGRRGYVDGELNYFYSRTMNLGEKIEHIPASKTYVQYNNDDHPHVEVYQSRVDIPEWMNKVFFIEWMNQNQQDYYVMIVPEGTITTDGQYEIDMR